VFISFLHQNYDGCKLKTVVHNVWPAGLRRVLMWPVTSNRKSDYFRAGVAVTTYSR